MNPRIWPRGSSERRRSTRVRLYVTALGLLLVGGAVGWIMEGRNGVWL